MDQDAPEPLRVEVRWITMDHPGMELTMELIAPEHEIRIRDEAGIFALRELVLMMLRRLPLRDRELILSELELASDRAEETVAVASTSVIEAGSHALAAAFRDLTQQVRLL